MVTVAAILAVVIALFSWGRPRADIVGLLVVLAGSVGSVPNSSAIAAMFIPIVLRISSKTGLNHKRMLMPLCGTPCGFGNCPR